jgi:hypothetical protein
MFGSKLQKSSSNWKPKLETIMHLIIQKFRLATERAVCGLFAFLLLGAGFSSFTLAQTPPAELAVVPDFERELRWRNEVVPSLVVGDAIDLDVNGKKVLALLTRGKPDFKGKPDLPAIVLVHGVGVHPDHGIIGILRNSLSDLGYTTLSVQMPVLPKETTDSAQYAAIFSHSTARIAAASQYLTKEKLDATGLVLLSHSMGSWMSNVYLQDSAKAPFVAWVCLSITGRIGSTGEHRLPILDIQAENDLEPVRRGSWLRAIKVMNHPGSKRIEIVGANHFYEKQEAQLLKEVDGFLKVLTKNRTFTN